MVQTYTSWYQKRMKYSEEKKLLAQIASELQKLEHLNLTETDLYEELSDNYATLAESILPLWDDTDEE